MLSITRAIEQFKLNWTLELSPEKIASACRDCKMKWIESLLNPVTTIQIFMLQILHGNTACNHLPHLAKLSFTGAACCTARMRIKLDVFKLLLERCVSEIQSGALDTGRWLGHRVFLVDGSSFSMPDTPVLQDHFGQPGGQKRGCGFPVAHWLVLMHLGTGMITKMLASPLRTGDMSKMVELHPELKANDLLVGDRAFCSFAHLCLLIERGVEALLRINQNMIVDLTAGWPYVIPNRGTGSKR